MDTLAPSAFDAVTAHGRAGRGRAPPQPSMSPLAIIYLTSSARAAQRHGCKLVDELHRPFLSAPCLPGLQSAFARRLCVPARLKCTPHALDLAITAPSGDFCLKRTPRAMSGGDGFDGGDALWRSLPGCAHVLERVLFRVSAAHTVCCAYALSSCYLRVILSVYLRDKL